MTKIEWTEATWNPLAGCSIVSPGCTHCYAMRMAHRLAAMGVPHYQGLTKVVNGNPVWTGKLHIAPDHIVEAPLRRTKPTMYFVNSMSDLFHEDVPDEWIDRVHEVMAKRQQHTFQVLTKRSERMREYISSPRRHVPPVGSARFWNMWPLPNVWYGVSAERQKEADERIPDLLATPAAVRFVSAEPLLGQVKFDERWLHPLYSVNSGPAGPEAPRVVEAGLDWVIVGGESGHGAQPMHFDWARAIVNQCREAGVAVFVKQMGRTARSNRRDAAQAVALGAGWRADGPGAPEGIVSFRSAKGGDQIEWPCDLRVREMPLGHPDSQVIAEAVPKAIESVT